MDKYYATSIFSDNNDISNIFNEKFDNNKMNEKFNIILDWFNIYISIKNKKDITLNKFINILNLLDIELYEILYNSSNKLLINENFLIDFFNNEYYKIRIINKLQLKYNNNIIINTIKNNKFILIIYFNNIKLLDDLLNIYKLLVNNTENIFIIGHENILIRQSLNITHLIYPLSEQIYVLYVLNGHQAITCSYLIKKRVPCSFGLADDSNKQYFLV